MQNILNTHLLVVLTVLLIFYNSNIRIREFKKSEDPQSTNDYTNQDISTSWKLHIMGASGHRDTRVLRRPEFCPDLPNTSPSVTDGILQILNTMAFTVCFRVSEYFRLRWEVDVNFRFCIMSKVVGGHGETWKEGNMCALCQFSPMTSFNTQSCGMALVTLISLRRKLGP